MSRFNIFKLLKFLSELFYIYSRKLLTAVLTDSVTQPAPGQMEVFGYSLLWGNSFYVNK